MEGFHGDFNKDGIVNAADYTVWRNHLGEVDEANVHANGDGGDVAIGDYNLWKSKYGDPASGADTGGIGVSEPTAVVLLMAAATGRRRRWR